MKKVIYIDIDDEVTSIYDQIRRVKQKDIYLVIPRKAIIFQSIVNLRILKSKTAEAKKNLHLVTTDRVGAHLAAKVGLPVYENLKIEEVKLPKQKTSRTEIEPMQAKKNEVFRDLPKRIIEKKTTIGELIREYRHQNKKDKKGNTEVLGVYSYIRPKRRFLGFIIALSIALFFLITYIALPGATIYIKPKFDNIEHNMNVVLADKSKNEALLAQNDPNVIPSEEVYTKNKQTKVFESTEKRFDGVNAKGKITIINTSKNEWPLKDGTRFQTEDGLVFRLKEGVFVPGQRTGGDDKEIPGTLVVSVEADPFDIYEQPIGDRGNIQPTKFFLPGLSAYNQKIIWGESTEPMSGGITSYKKIIGESDIIAAKKQIEDNLIILAKEDLQKHIEEINEANQSHLVLLDDDRFLKIKLVSLDVPKDLEGSLQNEFEINAEIEASGIAYDEERLFNVLRKNLASRTHPDMQLIESSVKRESIHFDQASFDAEESYDEALGQIKVTVSIKGIQEYVIDSSMQAGLRFSNKVKEKILGMAKKDAEAYIGNLPEVENVKIKLWPFWISKIPHIADNIQIKLMAN